MALNFVFGAFERILGVDSAGTLEWQTGNTFDIGTAQVLARVGPSAYATNYTDEIITIVDGSSIATVGGGPSSGAGDSGSVVASATSSFWEVWAVGFYNPGPTWPWLVRHVSATGTVLTTLNPPTGLSSMTFAPLAIGVSPDSSTLYFAGDPDTDPDTVYAYNLLTQSGPTLFLSNPGQGPVRALRVLQDTSMVIAWNGGDVKRYSSAAATLTTCSGLPTGSRTQIALAEDASSFFYMGDGGALAYGVVFRVQSLVGTVSETYPLISGTAGINRAYPFTIGVGTTPPTDPAIVVDVSIDCTTSIVTIVGQNFAVGASISVQDPFGNDVPFTLVSFSSTQIVILLTYAGPGNYRVTVTNPT